MNTQLDEMTTEIDKLRLEQKSRKVTIKKERISTLQQEKEIKAKKPKKLQGNDAGKTTEQRFRDLIKEVQDRVSQIKLEKNDWQTYSEVQSEVDNFLDEATQEIMSIKKGLRQRFENINAGKGENKRRSKSRSKFRKPRGSKKGEAEGTGDAQNSVFANPIQD